MFFQLLKNIFMTFVLDMLSQKTLIQTLNRMSKISRRRFGVNTSSSYDLV